MARISDTWMKDSLREEARTESHAQAVIAIFKCAMIAWEAGHKMAAVRASKAAIQLSIQAGVDERSDVRSATRDAVYLVL